jgi:TPR repeat protein
MYQNGRGIKQSFLMAKELYELAIQQEDVDSMINLGVLYGNGSGVEKDIAKARNLFIKAEALGNETATTYLKILDDKEREDAALDPSSIVCSFCGLPETQTRNFSKTKCPCKSTWYCNTNCQKKHWKMHRNDCKRLIAEMKQEKKMKKEALSKRNTDDTTRTKDEADKPVPKKENLNDGDDDGDDDGIEKTSTSPQQKNKEKLKTEEEKEGDECPICLEELPKFGNQFTRFTCCGKGIHTHCFKDMESMKMAGTCPFCRASRPTQEEQVKYLRPWVKKKKAWAQNMMGQAYRDGEGVKQSYEMARRLFEQAAQQGDANAICSLGLMYYQGHSVEQSYEKAKEHYEQAAQLGHSNAQFSLGFMYHNGQGVEQSYEKAKEYYEQAAQLGHPNAQYHLGRMYATGEGVVKNEIKAHALWTLAASQGDIDAIEMLPILEKNMKKS